MFTRSKAKVHLNFIDFNEASEAWRANKKYVGNGTYKYVCSEITQSGNHCKNNCLLQSDYCKIHSKKHAKSINA